MLSRTSASAGLAAVIVTAGTLLMSAPASARTPTAATHVGADAAQARASAPYDDGWWWHHRHFRHHRFHHFRHFDEFGFRHSRDFGFPDDDFAGNVNRNVNVVSNNIDISNSNTNVAVARGW